MLAVRFAEFFFHLFYLRTIQSRRKQRCNEPHAFICDCFRLVFVLHFHVGNSFPVFAYSIAEKYPGFCTDRCCIQFPLFTTSRTLYASCSASVWPEKSVAREDSPSCIFCAYQRNQRTQETTRFHVLVSQTVRCSLGAAPAISAIPFTSVRLYGTICAGNSRCVRPHDLHSITRRRKTTSPSELRSFLKQVP